MSRNRFLFIIGTVVALIVLTVVLGRNDVSPETVAASMLATTLRFATPITLGALAGLFCERSGVVNIAIEGMMLAAAVGAWLAAALTQNLMIGVLAGILTGMLMGLLHAWLSVTFKVDQIVSGTVINILAVGLTGFLDSQLLTKLREAGLQSAGLLPQLPIPVLSDLPILGGPQQLERVIQEHGINQVILLEFPLTESNQNIIRICDHLGIRLFILSDLEERLRHSVTHFEDGGFRFIGLREEPLENPLNRFCKRAIDLAISIPVMLIVFPLLSILVFLSQRLQSPGPLFHVQRRAGMQNRQFEILKFRTMRPDHDEVARQASHGDDRVYPLGHWFRRLSIDEVPQFWNVLKGDMSIVGPRPHLIEHNQQFSQLMQNYHVRTFVKPGITGLAQVRGFRGEARDPSDIENRITCDIEYLENWNLSLECDIILRTVVHVVFPPRSAY